MSSKSPHNHTLALSEYLNSCITEQSKITENNITAETDSFLISNQMAEYIYNNFFQHLADKEKFFAEQLPKLVL